MAETPDITREDSDPHRSGAGMSTSDLRAWFIREVLPLEPALTQYLHTNWRNRSDIDDLLQEIYVRVCEAAKKQKPESARHFVFTTAKNLLVDRVRRERVIPIEAVEDLGALNAAIDEPGPDRNVMAREELRRVQLALDKLPPRAREAVILRRVEGLSRRNIAQRMGITEATVAEHLAHGMSAIADILGSEEFAGPGRKP